MTITPTELADLGRFNDAQIEVIKLLKARFNNLGALELSVLASKIVQLVIEHTVDRDR